MPSIRGERRGMLTVINPATAKSIMLDRTSAS
jgi:hypothetical protein